MRRQLDDLSANAERELAKLRAEYERELAALRAENVAVRAENTRLREENRRFVVAENFIGDTAFDIAENGVPDRKRSH